MKVRHAPMKSGAQEDQIPAVEKANSSDQLPNLFRTSPTQARLALSNGGSSIDGRIEFGYDLMPLNYKTEQMCNALGLPSKDL